MSIEENVYPNLVKVFYSNTELSATRLDRIVTNIGGIPIQFDIKDLNLILRTENMGLKLCTLRKKLICNHFLHVNEVRNICRRRDLFDDVCTLFFPSQLLPLQV